MHDLGEGLAARIETLVDEPPSIKITLVADSMGGLAASDAIARLKTGNPAVADTIKALVVLMTPSHGQHQAESRQVACRCRLSAVTNRERSSSNNSQGLSLNWASLPVPPDSSKIPGATSMKTLIVAMGNVGIMHGWALAEAGADITHVVRKGSLGRVEGGVQMDILDLRGDLPKNYQTRYLPKLVDEIDRGEGYELVVVATKHYQAADAVRLYRDLAPGADFLMFTANWDGTGEIDALLPRSRYLWGYSIASGGRGEDGVLYANLQQGYRINELDGSRTPRLNRVAVLFGNAGFVPDIKPNIIEWLWVHHAINAGLIGVALYAGGLPGPDTGLVIWVLTVRAVKDALAVLEKRGVDVSSQADAKPFLRADEEESAKDLRWALMGMPHYERTMKHGHFNTSVEEMRRFYLDVLDTGELLGVPMPYLGSLKVKIGGSPGSP
jgi:ketopantoate reductase